MHLFAAGACVVVLGFFPPSVYSFLPTNTWDFILSTSAPLQISAQNERVSVGCQHLDVIACAGACEVGGGDDTGCYRGLLSRKIFFHCVNFLIGINCSSNWHTVSHSYQCCVVWREEHCLQHARIFTLVLFCQPQAMQDKLFSPLQTQMMT